MHSRRIVFVFWCSVVILSMEPALLSAMCAYYSHSCVLRLVTGCFFNSNFLSVKSLILIFFLLKWSYVCSKVASALCFCPQNISLIGIQHSLHVCDDKLLSIHPGVWFQGVILKAVCHMEPWDWVIVVESKSAVPAMCACMAVSVMWYETYFTSAWTRNSENFSYKKE